MLHPINPLVDCVFKAIFGDPENADLLLSLLNAVLRPAVPIREVEILNPYVPQEFPSDDQRVLEVRARIHARDHAQLEVQLQVRPWMASRVLYTWADVYQSQLQRGSSFRELRPVISIWVLGQTLLPQTDRWHHRFAIWDHEADLRLSDHLQIHTLELPKWSPKGPGLAADDLWMYFFREASRWTELPPDLHTPEMEKAMRILERFSEKERDYHDYQSRMNFLREQASLEEERAEMLSALEEQKKVLQEQQQTLEEQQETLARQQQAIARLRAQMRAAGLDPDA